MAKSLIQGRGYSTLSSPVWTVKITGAGGQGNPLSHIGFCATMAIDGPPDCSSSRATGMQEAKLSGPKDECKESVLRPVGLGGTLQTDHFRQTMGHFATGVTIVTSIDAEGKPVGLTANSVASVSLVPSLLLVCVDRGSSSLAAIRDTGAFGVSVLREEDEDLAHRFSVEAPGVRFRGVESRPSPAGVPLLPDPLAWMDCRLWKWFEAGDHMILIGEVVDCGADPESRPLVFFRGRYGSISP